MLPTDAEIVIVGGGVMGASTAYHLAKRGMKGIVLLERDSFFGQGSTGRCAGGIRHQFSTAVNIELSIKSIAMLENFQTETNQPIDMKQCGYLFLLSTEEELAQFRANVALQHQHGIMSEIWSVEQIAARVPLLNLEGIIAGTYYHRDGICDPSGVVNGYIAAAKALGVQTLSGVEVTAIDMAEGRIRAVKTTQGDIATTRVVNAAGAWAGKLAEMVGVTLPIHPERQQCLVTTPMPTIPDDFPFVIDFHQRLYFHREGAGLLTGYSITAEQPTFVQEVDLDHEMTHIERAIERLPVMETAGKLSNWAGLYEVTPDAHPIIGAVPQLPEFHVVAGFSGHGFMHGPIAGLLVAEQILDGHAHTVDISSLAYERFDAGRVISEFNVV
jgi:sarcosine oxidase subunit beta